MMLRSTPPSREATLPEPDKEEEMALLRSTPPSREATVRPDHHAGCSRCDPRPPRGRRQAWKDARGRRPIHAPSREAISRRSPDGDVAIHAPLAGGDP